MFSIMEMHNATVLMREHDEDKEQAEGGGWDKKKVTGDEVVDMIGEKGLPGQ
jgi:hypothetical protein